MVYSVPQWQFALLVLQKGLWSIKLQQGGGEVPAREVLLMEIPRLSPVFNLLFSSQQQNVVSLPRVAT